MNQNHLKTINPSHNRNFVTRTVRRILIISLIGVSSVSLAGHRVRIDGDQSEDSDDIDPRVAAALAIESCREIQGAVIDTDFQNEVRASLAAADRRQAMDACRQAAQRRELRLGKLAIQLTNMETAYNTWAASESEEPARPLDMATAATRLRTIAASSPISDNDSYEQTVVQAILRKTVFKRHAVLVAAELPRPSGLAQAAAVAQAVDVPRFSLGLLAVAAFLIAQRLSHRVGSMEESGWHGLWKRS